VSHQPANTAGAGPKPGESADHEHGAGIVVPVLDKTALSDLEARINSDEYFWLHLDSPSDEQLDQLGQLLHFHPLALRSAKAFGQRPKFELADNYGYLVYYGAYPRDEQEQLLQEFHLFISGRYIVSIHQGSDNILKDLREEIVEQPIRSKQFLTYEILATIADSFFPLLSGMDEEIATTEDGILDNPSIDELQKINALKHDLTTLRRIVTPQRDIFARAIEDLNTIPGLDSETDRQEYFRDIYDHLIRVSDLVDSYRDLASGSTDLYLSTVANRQGEVSKQLAIVASIFLPLSFLTGFFGQNFAWLTGDFINHNWTFWVFGLGLLIVSVIAMIFFFKRKGWTQDTTATSDPPPRHTDTRIAARPHAHLKHHQLPATEHSTSSSN
jgi:magnesium transporter